MNNVLERVLAFNKDIPVHLLLHKTKVLTENPFRFLRGTNHLFYEDIKTSLPQSPLCWITGDLHLENFGSYKGENRLVYFDLNDFDEAMLAPVAYELVRMVTSIFIAFDSFEIKQKKAINMAKLYLQNYSATLGGGKPDYIEPRTAKGIVCTFLTAVEKRKLRDVLEKKTTLKKGKIQLIVGNQKHFMLNSDLKEDLISCVNDWLKNDNRTPYNYKVKDVVFRLAGTGSIGMKRYMILLKSSNDYGEKYMLLDMKQSKQPFLYGRFSDLQPHWNSEAERIITIQRRMENKIPALLSTMDFQGESYVMEEMQPTQDSINFNLIKENYRDVYQVINDMSMLTASAHLRSSGMSASAITDELIRFGNDSTWQESILQHAIVSAQQVRSNYMEYINDYAAYRKKLKKATVDTLSDAPFMIESQIEEGLKN